MKTVVRITEEKPPDRSKVGPTNGEASMRLDPHAGF